MSSNKNEREGLEKLWGTCTVERLEQVQESFEETKEFRILSEEEREIYLQLKNGIPEEMKPLLVKYSNTVQNILYQKGNFFYRKGFGDALLFTRAWMGDKQGLNLNVTIL